MPTLRSSDDLTDRVLALMEDPARPGMWDRRGMVVGEVQSGKTSNYIELACKAVDAGYRFVVVLTGSTNSLRSQTQLRFDEGFLGWDTRLNLQLGSSNRRVGVGALLGEFLYGAISPTNASENGDFILRVANQYNIRLGGDPVIMVVKKNGSVLRNAGLSYGDYLEQLTYLIFLKMMHELTQPPLSLLSDHQPPPIPEGCDWPSLLARDGADLDTQYRHTLETLSQREGTLGVIFSKAQSRIQEPAMLTRLVKELIDSENWHGLSADVKGDAYESLLERNAQDVKTGAGQYFTPRPLIQAIVDVMRPGPGTTICDPACGTGGFLLAAHEYIHKHNPTMNREQSEHLRNDALHGWEIVDSAARLGVMNLYLHGIGGDRTNIKVDDSLRAQPDDHYDMVLTNPPFGRTSTLTFVNEEGRTERQSLTVERPDFWATTSNRQLSFLQHVRTLLKMNGSAAIVLPDNVLFEGGAGEIIRRRLLHECDAHTLLRLPTGVFYAQGVKANVLFFDRRPASETPWTRYLWIYDLRTNQRFTLKTNPLTRAHLDDFVSCYHADDRTQREESERFKCFTYDELTQRDKANLDIFWLRDESLEDSENLPPPDVIAEEIMEDLRAALEQLEEIAAELGAGDDGG